MSDNDNQAAEVVDTSTNEELAAEAALESDDTGFDDGEDDGQDDEEPDAFGDADDDEDSEEEEADGPKEDVEETEQPEPKEKEKESDPEVERKRYNDEMAKKRIAERQAREEARAKAQQAVLDEVADNPNERDLRSLQIFAYNQTVQNNSDRLVNGFDKAVANIDLYKSEDPNVQAELDAALDEFQQMHVTLNEFGDPVEVRGDLYQFLANKAERIRRLTGIREVNQKKARAKTQARTDTLPSKTPKKPKVDPDLEAFDEEASRW